MAHPAGYRSERVKFSVKNQKNDRLLLELLEKWLSYKLRRFWMFLKFFLILFNPSEKLKNSIFEIPIIPQILNISNKRTTSAKSINVDIIRKLLEYFLENVLVKAIFTLTFFEILLFEGKLILWTAQRVTGNQRVKDLNAF